MKKISLYLLSLVALTAMWSCTEDFNADVADPQAWEQEDMVSVPDLTLIPAAAINLETLTAATVQLFTVNTDDLLEGSELGVVVAEVTNDDGSASAAMAHDNGVVSADDLQAVVELFYGKEPVERTLKVNAVSYVDFEGQATRVVADAISVKVTPRIPVIVPEYYIVGGAQGWDPASKALAFFPIDAEAGTLSITANFSAYPDGTTGPANFKIFAGEQMGSWDNGSFGTAVDGDTSLSGTIVANGGAIMAPTAEFYTLNIDVISNTYEMEAIADQEPVSYTTLGLIGDHNGWGEQEAMTEVAPHNWYLAGFVQPADGGLKFRADDDWGLNWGGAVNVGDVNYGTLYNNGDNVVVPAGTYDVHFNDITGQMYFITVE